MADASNDNEVPPVTLILGRVRRHEDEEPVPVHIFLMSPDDDTAVRRTLEALRAKGYSGAELDQIGQLEGEPDEEPHHSAYQGALEGEVSIVAFPRATRR